MHFIYTAGAPRGKTGRRVSVGDTPAGTATGLPRQPLPDPSPGGEAQPPASSRGPEERVARGAHRLPRLAARAAAAISRAGKGAGVRRLRGTMATAAMSSEGKRRGQERP